MFLKSWIENLVLLCLVLEEEKEIPRGCSRLYADSGEQTGEGKMKERGEKWNLSTLGILRDKGGKGEEYLWSTP